MKQSPRLESNLNWKMREPAWSNDRVTYCCLLAFTSWLGVDWMLWSWSRWWCRPRHLFQEYFCQSFAVLSPCFFPFCCADWEWRRLARIGYVIRRLNPRPWSHWCRTHSHVWASKASLSCPSTLREPPDASPSSAGSEIRSARLGVAVIGKRLRFSIVKKLASCPLQFMRGIVLAGEMSA